MRRSITTLAAIALIAASCGGGSAGSCEAVADDAIELIQDLVDQISAMSIDEILAAGDTFPGQEEFERKGEDLQKEADDIGCSDDEMEQLITARVDQLQSDSEFGRLIIEGIRSEGFFSE